MKRKRPFFFILVLLLHSFCIHAQDKRAQYPGVLKKSFFGLSVGYINYHFSATQLEPGYTVASIHVPHTAVRLVLFGYRFNKNISAAITYMRPISFVEYKNING